MGTKNLKKEDAVSYSQFACVGTGFSAIGLGATLKRWYGIDDIVFFEKYGKLGGTWFISQYPGIFLEYFSSLTAYRLADLLDLLVNNHR